MTTMEFLGILSNYSWDSKIVIALAAFALKFGEYWLLTYLNASNPLAKSITMLKHTHQVVVQQDQKIMGHKHEGIISNLIKTMLDVTNCIVEFEKVPSRYKLAATTRIPIAVYWTIRSIVASASQVSGFMSRNSHSYIYENIYLILFLCFGFHVLKIKQSSLFIIYLLFGLILDTQQHQLQRLGSFHVWPTS